MTGMTSEREELLTIEEVLAVLGHRVRPSAGAAPGHRPDDDPTARMERADPWRRT
jgi:hypothetical protein